jgi:hypothetical protein
MSRPEVHRDWRLKGLLGVNVLMFMCVEFGAKKDGSVVFVVVVLVEESSRTNLFITCGVELDARLVVADAVVLLEGKVNLGVALLLVELELEIVTLLIDRVDAAADLLELIVDGDLEPELVPMEDLAELVLTEGLTEFVLTEDIALLEAHPFVFGVYNGPSGG